MLITDIDAPTGGTQKQAHSLIADLTARGHTVIVLTRNYHRRPAHEVRAGVEYHRLPVLGKWRLVNSAIFLFGALAWLIYHRSRYDIVHGHQAYAPSVIGALASALTHRPVIVKVTASNEYGEAQEIRCLPFAGLRLRLLRRVDRIVALTSEIMLEFAALGISRQQIVRIPNGVRVPPAAAYEPGVRDEARAHLRLPSSKIVVYAGRLSAEKGLDTLLRAWREVLVAEPEALLLLLGEGGMHRNFEPELRCLARNLNIGHRVHFMGHVENVADYLLAADVFVLGSISEGMSNALLEAMAAGLAVAATDIPANADVVRDAEHALLFSPGDAAANARVLQRLLADAKLRERLGRAARARAVAEFSLPEVANRYLGLYAELLAAEGSCS